MNIPVYHSSNVKIAVLQSGSCVTPEKEISKEFGLDKPGPVHYCHTFEADEEDLDWQFNGDALWDLAYTLRPLKPVMVEEY